VTMVLTWLCSLVDDGVRWLLCLTYAAEIFNKRIRGVSGSRPRSVRNSEGYSDGRLCQQRGRERERRQNLQGYILSDEGTPSPGRLRSGAIVYYAVRRRGHDHEPSEARPRRLPTSRVGHSVLRVQGDRDRKPPAGDAFANAPGDDGRGTDPAKNLHTLQLERASVAGQRAHARPQQLQRWPDKFANPAGSYFGDGSISDRACRVDTDSTCSHPDETRSST